MVRLAVRLLHSDIIKRLEIFYLPEEFETPGSLNPQMLEGACLYKIEIRDFHLCPKLRSGLISALERSAVTKTTDQGDLRWGCVLYNAKGVRVMTMYFSRVYFGPFTTGLIGGTPVATNGEVNRFLRSRCSCLWAGDHR